MPTTPNSTCEMVKTEDKKHSVIFKPVPDADPNAKALFSAFYVNRPHSNGHTRARLTIEWLD